MRPFIIFFRQRRKIPTTPTIPTTDEYINISDSPNDHSHVDKTKIVTADNWIFMKNNTRATVIDIQSFSVDLFTFNQTTTVSDNANSNVSNAVNAIELRVNYDECSKEEIVDVYQKLIDKMWKTHLGDKGADATDLSHTAINVNPVKQGNNDYNNIVRKYIGCKAIFRKRIKRNGQLPRLSDLYCKQIQTTEVINTITSMSGKHNRHA